jgi:hypothetical protein
MRADQLPGTAGMGTSVDRPRIRRRASTVASRRDRWRARQARSIATPGDVRLAVGSDDTRRVNLSALNLNPVFLELVSSFVEYQAWGTFWPPTVGTTTTPGSGWDSVYVIADRAPGGQEQNVAGREFAGGKCGAQCRRQRERRNRPVATTGVRLSAGDRCPVLTLVPRFPPRGREVVSAQCERHTCPRSAQPVVSSAKHPKPRTVRDARSSEPSEIPAGRYLATVDHWPIPVCLEKHVHTGTSVPDIRFPDS